MVRNLMQLEILKNPTIKEDEEEDYVDIFGDGVYYLENIFPVGNGYFPGIHATGWLLADLGMQNFVEECIDKPKELREFLDKLTDNSFTAGDNIINVLVEFEFESGHHSIEWGEEYEYVCSYLRIVV